VEEDLHLLRGQDRGRLVHDQELGVLQETTDDLHPLPFPRAQVAHHPAGIERQSVGAADIVDALGEVAGLGRILHPQRDVLGHAERLEQEKCWNTIATPEARAARGSAGV
jgi:hypothetical protein